MKRHTLLLLLVGGGIAAVALYFSFARMPQSRVSEGMRSAASTADESSAVSVRSGSAQLQVSRLVPGAVIGGRTAFVGLITADLDLSDAQVEQLSRFVSEYRSRVLAAYCANAAFEEISPSSVQARVSLSADAVNILRRDCYAGIGDIVGAENLAWIVNGPSARVLDGEFEDFGEFPFTLNVTLARSDPLDLVRFRTEKKRVIGDEEADTFKEGALIPADFQARYGVLGDEILRRLR